MKIPPELRPIRLVPPWKLWLPLLAFMFLIGLAVVAAMPAGPYRYETGRVIGFVILPQKGPMRHVEIRLNDGQQIQERMRFEVDCRVGDHIALKHYKPLLIGDRYAVSGPFPCRRPTLP